MSVISERREVVVIGGGQAGLAVGYLLARQERSFDSLPGRAFPGHPDAYPGRDDVVAYLSDYARELELPVELDSPVRAVRAGDGGYVVELDHRTYEADQVVIATGPFQLPQVPEMAARLDPDIVRFHSSEYRSPQDVPAGPVLVVGGGNTGFQIAQELSDTYDVHLSIGSRQTPLPQRILGRDLFRYLEATGLMGKTITSSLGQRMQGRDALIGSSPRAARRRHGIELHGRTVEVSGTEVRFHDGSRLTPGAVIWATGFALDHSFVQLPVFDEDGRLVHQRGVTAAPGLYFLGLPWQHTRGSALLGWVKNDAAHVAAQIATFAATGIGSAPAALAAGRLRA
jgi:putative flavoprotein involved in K+ transport